MSVIKRPHEVEAEKMAALYKKLDNDKWLEIVMDHGGSQKNPDKKKKAPEDVHHLGNGAYQAKNHMGNE